MSEKPPSMSMPELLIEELVGKPLDSVLLLLSHLLFLPLLSLGKLSIELRPS